MLEYLTPRQHLPLTCESLATYHDTTEVLLPSYLHAASGRRLRLHRGKLQVLSHQRPCWVDEKGKLSPYISISAFSTNQRLRYVPVKAYHGFCKTEGRSFICHSYTTPTACPQDPTHILHGPVTPVKYQAHDITPTFLTLLPNGEAVISGTASYTLPVKGPLIDVISSALGVCAIRATGEVYFARTVMSAFEPSSLHDGVKLVEVVFYESDEGIFTAGVTFDGKLMVRGRYRGVLYSTFSEVPWPE